MSNRKYSSKIGNIGELAFIYWCNCNQWCMFRTQPETRVTRNGIIHCGNGGIADFTGYRYNGIGQPIYTAVEVKTRHGKSMSASGLTDLQKQWMRKLPKGNAFVYIFWIDYNVGQIYEYIDTGAYKLPCPQPANSCMKDYYGERAIGRPAGTAHGE